MSSQQKRQRRRLPANHYRQRKTLRRKRESFEKSELEHARTEERLRTQKTAWQIVSGSLLLAFLF